MNRQFERQEDELVESLNRGEITVQEYNREMRRARPQRKPTRTNWRGGETRSHEERKPVMYRKFWMVWNPNGRQPVYKHPTRGSAVTEAERLARLNRGEQFIVLAAERAVTVADVQHIELREDADDELPF